jgi:hypothetical protein
MTGQFGVVVADHHARQPAMFGEGGEFADDMPNAPRRQSLRPMPTTFFSAIALTAIVIFWL